MRGFASTGVSLFLLVSTIACAQQPQQSQQQLMLLHRLFVGSWTGVLEYRDYQSDKMVRLPTWLEIQTSPRGPLHLTYIYDDGPTKTVVERSTVTLDAQANTYTVTSDRDHSSDIYRVSGYQDLLSKGLGILTMTGTGQENDKPVEVRITLTIGRNLYIFRKETREAGQEFRTRDEYVFTRRDPPPVPAP
jgi:hypothetical protein